MVEEGNLSELLDLHQIVIKARSIKTFVAVTDGITHVPDIGVGGRGIATALTFKLRNNQYDQRGNKQEKYGQY